MGFSRTGPNIDPLPMTGYTVHTGSSQKFSEGWDQIFRGRAGAKTSPPATSKASSKAAAKSAKTPRKSK